MNSSNTVGFRGVAALLAVGTLCFIGYLFLRWQDPQRTVVEKKLVEITVHENPGVREVAGSASGVSQNLAPSSFATPRVPSTDARDSFVGISACRFRGFGEETLSVESILFAVEHGDIQRFSEGVKISEAARSLLRQTWEGFSPELKSVYETPEHILMMAYALQISDVAGIQIGEKKVVSAIKSDLIVKRQSSKPGKRVLTDVYEFELAPNGWQLVLPDSAVRNAIPYLMNSGRKEIKGGPPVRK